MIFETPRGLKAEHEELHQELAQAMHAGGRTGEAAREVASLLHPHFVKEEQFALPPLGLLGALSRGEVSADMGEVTRLTDRLEAEMPRMLAEHEKIVEALGRLVEAAIAEHKLDYVRFAEKLMAHAQMEEEVSYPAAVLVGRYVKVMLAR